MYEADDPHLHRRVAIKVMQPELAANPVTDVGALALASSPHLGRLTGRTLWECRKIGAKGKRALKARFGVSVSFAD